MDKNRFIIYSIKEYSNANKEFIEKKAIIIDKLKKLEKELKTDNNYHFRVHKKTQYIFFGDIDGYVKGIDNFINTLKLFLKKSYNLDLEVSNVKYTANNDKGGSFHHSIPKWNGSVEKLKEIHNNLLKEYKDEFSFKQKKK